MLSGLTLILSDGAFDRLRPAFLWLFEVADEGPDDRSFHSGQLVDSLITMSWKCGVRGCILEEKAFLQPSLHFLGCELSDVRTAAPSFGFDIVKRKREYLGLEETTEGGPDRAFGPGPP